MDFTQSMDNGYMIPTSVAVGSGEATDIRCVCDTVEDFKTFLDTTDMELRYEGLITYEKVNKLLKVYKGNDTWQTVGEGGENVDTSSFITLTQLSQQLSNYYTKAQTDNKISEEIEKIQISGGLEINEVIVSDNPPVSDTKIWIRNTHANITYPKIVLDSTPTSIEEGKWVNVGVKLDMPPLGTMQVVNITSVNKQLLINKSSMTFTQTNYNVYQYVKIEHTIDNNETDSNDVVVFTTENEEYKQLPLVLIDAGEVDPNLYSFHSSDKSGDGLASIEGTVKDIKIFGNTVDGSSVGKLNANGKYNITICSSNGGNLAVGEKSKNNSPSSTEVGSTITQGSGYDSCTGKIHRNNLPSVIHIGASENSGARTWQCDKNDKLLEFTSVWGVQTPRQISILEDTEYVIFGYQQSECIDSLIWSCWSLGGQNSDNAQHATRYSEIDKIEFEISHPLRSSGSVKDEIRFNKLLSMWEVVKRIDDDGSILSEEIVTQIEQTKEKLKAYDIMTRFYMMEGGVHPVIECNVPVSVNTLSLNECKMLDENKTNLANIEDYEDGLYIKEGEDFVPLKIMASNIKLKDTLNNFASKNVEGVLMELEGKIKNVDLSSFTFNDINGLVPINKLPMQDIKNNIGSNLEVTTVSKLRDKNIICAGDSITAGTFVSFTSGTYPTILKNKTGANVDNVAFPGDAFTDAESKIKNSSIESPDIITFMYGANDVTSGVPAGSVSDVTKDSIVKRVKDLIDYCNINYPESKLVFMTTLPRKGYLTQMEQYRVAIIEACRTYGAYCLDVHGKSGISLYTTDLEAKWTNGDGCHFSQNAHDNIASILISYLESIV